MSNTSEKKIMQKPDMYKNVHVSHAQSTNKPKTP